jgi:hypothetical protein
MEKKYKGWSYRKQPFSYKQFKDSWIKKNISRLSYNGYLKEYARQSRLGKVI